MVFRRLAVAAALGCMVACQGPTTVAPTSAPAAPTPAPPTSAPAVPTAAPPTSAPTAAPLATTVTRVEALNAANLAYSGGDLQTAAALYQRVLNTPPSPTEAATATAAINDLADFRSLLALLSVGREDEARTHVDALQKRDPNAPLARLANQVWDQYGMTGEVRAACAQAQPQVATQGAQVLAALQGLGVVNIDATSLCSVPRA
jgi:tetratricopeptide (TPR) repeat protein